MGKKYEFKTVWIFDAPIEKVWEEIENSKEWSDWWKAVLNVEELKAGDENGVGKTVRSTWRSALPYKLSFDSEIMRVEKMKLIEVRAFGELDGKGLWQLESQGENKTRVQYDWIVSTEKSWMNFLAPIAKPFFKWNHTVSMRWGGEGLAKRLNCNLLEMRDS